MDVAEETDIEIEVDDFSGGSAEECGRCVRHPPAFFHPGLLNGEFPVVSASAWCGEFKRDIE
jgi:hypothetical protein